MATWNCFSRKPFCGRWRKGNFSFFKVTLRIVFTSLCLAGQNYFNLTWRGRRVNLQTINKWQMFGAIGEVRENAQYPATEQALQHSAALALECSFLHETLKTCPYLNFDLMQLITGYIQEMQERFRELAAERVKRLIAITVLRLAHAYELTWKIHLSVHHSTFHGPPVELQYGYQCDQA